MAALRRLGFFLVIAGLMVAARVVLGPTGAAPSPVEAFGVQVPFDPIRVPSALVGEPSAGTDLSELAPTDESARAAADAEAGAPATPDGGTGPAADATEAGAEPDTTYGSQASMESEPGEILDGPAESDPPEDADADADPDPQADGRQNRPLASSALITPGSIDVGVRQRGGQEFFVDPVHGVASNPGTSEDRAWASLARALGELEAGQTLNLMSGDYTETMAPGAAHYLVVQGGTADDWVRITAAPGHRPVIVGTTLPALEVRADFVEVSNLQVEGRGYDADNSWGVGLAARDSHHVVFDGNRVSGFALAGINTIRSSDVSVMRNRVFGNAFFSPNQGSGISLWRSKNHAGDTGVNRIVGNVVYENENKVESGFWPGLRTDGNGIIIDESRFHDYRGSFEIANNLVFNNGGRAIHIWKSDRVDVVFNTTYHNAWSKNLNGKAELSAGHSGNLRFLNNLVWADIDNGIPAMNVDIDPRTGRSTAGVFSAGNLLVTRSGSVAIGADDQVTNRPPAVVRPGISPSDIDFRPMSNSRLVDAGVGAVEGLAVAVRTDFLGNRRGSPPDVGAYEFID